MIGFALIMIVLLYAFYIFGISFIVWMAIDAGKQDKFLWLVLILAVPFIGAIVYFFTEKEGNYWKIPEIGGKKK
ncbi:MAG: hypothetical protein JWN37_914 [Candidatus Nomurabacteria bacterium]|nr:hypothetical protein [Candidatus Nomurabacteria bacterium]